MKSTALTPLARALRHLGLRQKDLAIAMGKPECTITRYIKGQASIAAAEQIFRAIPKLAKLIDERHVLYPFHEPYYSWRPRGWTEEDESREQAASRPRRPTEPASDRELPATPPAG